MAYHFIGNRYILTTSDYCTKWVEAFATPDKSAAEVCSCLFKVYMYKTCSLYLSTFIHVALYENGYSQACNK